MKIVLHRQSPLLLDRSGVAIFRGMSPTVLREGPYRLFFFSREEPRPHVHRHLEEIRDAWTRHFGR